MTERFQQALRWLAQTPLEPATLHWLASTPQLKGAVAAAFTCAEWNAVEPDSASLSNWSRSSLGLYTVVGRANPLNHWVGAYAMWSPSLVFWWQMQPMVVGDAQSSCPPSAPPARADEAARASGLAGAPREQRTTPSNVSLAAKVRRIVWLLELEGTADLPVRTVLERASNTAGVFVRVVGTLAEQADALLAELDGPPE
jgi:hypothetical protein